MVGPLLTLTAGAVAAIAIASTITLVFVFCLATLHATIETPSMRTRRARWAARRQRRHRRERRAALLETANASILELTELDMCVERTIEDGTDPFELEPLLDRYVELSLARQRCVGVLGWGEPARLEAKLSGKDVHERSTEILARRIAQAREVAARARQYEAAIEELAEIIRYCSEKAVTPDDTALLADSGLIASALAHCDALDVVESHTAAS